MRLYYVKEIEAPKGYVNSDEVFDVDASYQGEDVTVIEFTAEFENAPIKVEFSKTDITGEKEIAGAKLSVIDSEGKVVESWTSEAGKNHMIERLPVGKYTLREETAPYGYKIAKDVEFEVTETAEIQEVSMKDEYAVGKIIIEKTDEVTKKPIAGVEFEIRDKDGKVIETVVTDKDGHAESKELPICIYNEDGSFKEIKKFFLDEGVQIIREFYKKFTYSELKGAYYSSFVEEEEYLNYLSSDKMYVMLACGQYCYYVTRNTKHKIREYYGLDNKELKNLLHTSDDSVEFYLQYLLCKELHDLDLDKKGYANLFITDANCMYMRNYEKKALIKQNIYQLDKFNDDYNFYGFVSQIEEKGNKKASIINYIISEEDLIKNHSFKIINFFHDLLDKQKLLMYNQIGVRGVLLNCENTDIKDAEIIFEMIEECQLDWVVIGGGEHISIGQRRYEKFVNKINNKSNWTPISL